MFVPMIIWDSNELLFYTFPEMAQDDDEIIRRPMNSCDYIKSSYEVWRVWNLK
jgi:hypothetical protein